MTKIVYNDCYASFGLPREAILRYADIKGITLIYTDQLGKKYGRKYNVSMTEFETTNAVSIMRSL